MKLGLSPHLSFAALLALGLLLAACGERADEGAVTQRSAGSGSRTADAGRTKDSTRGRPAEGSGSSREGAGSTGVMGAAGDAREKANASGAEPKVDDNKLTAMVLTGLKADKELNPLRIDVDTRDGVVTLSGSVPSAAVKARASEIAQNVKDVKSVNNQLTLAAT